MLQTSTQNIQTGAGAYRPDVDGLRALAVLSVLLFHADFPFMHAGFIGVDIFFVISGFVITRSIYQDLERNKFSIAMFYFKRIRRIMPALLVVYAVTALFALLLLLPADLAGFGKSLLASGTFVSNMYFWKASGYFAAAAETQPLLHTWSLSVEEQYYLFAPIFFLLTFRWNTKLRLVLAILCIGAVLSWLCAVAAVFTAPTAGFFLLPARLWELLAGAIVAMAGMVRPAGRPPLFSQASSYLGMILLLVGFITIHETDPFPGWNALFPCIGTALLIHAGVDPSQPLANRLFATRLPVAIGALSYSLYLVHWPLIAFLRYRLNRDFELPETIGILAVSLFLAYLSWRFVEQPFRHLSYDVAPRAFNMALASIVLVGAVGGGLWVSQGLPQRFPDFHQRRIAGVELWGGNACFHQNASQLEAWDPEHCLRAAGTGGNVLLWGDSFAAHYLPGIIAHASPLNVNLYQYTFAGCPPILAYYSLARKACSQFNEDAYQVIADQKIDTVVLSARWSDVPSRTMDRLNETIAELEDKGLRVVVIGPSPQFTAEVQRLDYFSGQSNEKGEVFTSPIDATRIRSVVHAQAGKADYVDPFAALCRPDGACRYRSGDDYVYADYGHLSGFGSGFAVEQYLLPALKKP